MRLYSFGGELLCVFSSEQIDMSAYNSGFYLLKIYTDKGVNLFRVLKINHFSLGNYMKQKKLLVIGWDAADWKVINPLIQEGKMPALKKLMERGVFGNLKTLDPPLSPMLWTSMATGVRPYKHGIGGFVEPRPDGEGLRPVSSQSRKS